MLVSFAVCLVLGAHPDFWLSDTAFEQKYCRATLMSVEGRNESLAHVRQRMDSGEWDKDESITDSLIKKLNKSLRQLDQDRLSERAKLLINYRQRIRR